MTVLDKIIKLKNDKGLSDLALERELGLGKRIVDSWKRGNSETYLKMIPQIADYFGVSTDYLLRSNLVENENNKKGTLNMENENKVLELMNALGEEAKWYNDLPPEAIVKIENQLGLKKGMLKEVIKLGNFCNGDKDAVASLFIEKLTEVTANLYQGNLLLDNSYATNKRVDRLEQKIDSIIEMLTPSNQEQPPA